MSDTLYKSFDWTLLDDRGFKEDSVREELISPLLVRLGYTASGADRIHRSKAVKHPFVYLGSRSFRIELIPDYLFQVSQKYRWVLDAKAPSENIRQGRNPQQAYSYAIHPEIRVRYFALCNGRDFTAFDIHTLVPVLDFPLRSVHDHWQQLTNLLGPEAFRDTSEGLNPDLGIHFYRLGIGDFETHHFVLIAVPLIARVTDTSYTIGGTYVFGDEQFCASFDFDASLLPQLMDVLPADARALAEDQLSRSPFTADLRTFLPHVTLSCKLGETVERTHNNSEEFCPFRVIKFSK